jgi:hypothetical protein
MPVQDSQWLPPDAESYQEHDVLETVGVPATLSIAIEAVQVRLLRRH